MAMRVIGDLLVSLPAERLQASNQCESEIQIFFSAASYIAAPAGRQADHSWLLVLLEDALMCIAGLDDEKVWEYFSIRAVSTGPNTGREVQKPGASGRVP